MILVLVGWIGVVNAQSPPDQIVEDVRTVLRDVGRPQLVSEGSFTFRAIAAADDARAESETRSRGTWTFNGEGVRVVVTGHRSSVEFFDDARRNAIRADSDAGPGALTGPESGWRAAEKVLARLSMAEPGLERGNLYGLTPYRRPRMSDDRLGFFTFAYRARGIPSNYNGVTIALDLKDLHVVSVRISRGWSHVEATPITRSDAAARIKLAYESAARRSPRALAFNRGEPDWSRVPDQLKLAYSAPVRPGDPLWPEQAVRLAYRWGVDGWNCVLDAETGQLNWESLTGMGSSPVPSDEVRRASNGAGHPVPMWTWLMSALFAVGAFAWFWRRRRESQSR